MRPVVLVRFVLVALGAVIVSTLAFGVAVAGATTVPQQFSTPVPGPTGTAATVAAIVAIASTAIVATAYGITALRRAGGEPNAAAVKLVPAVDETEHTRKAA
jgi:hypothetical protein